MATLRSAVSSAPSVEQVSKLYDDLRKLGLTDREIINRIFSKQTLCDIISAVNSVGEEAWVFLREFPLNGNLMLNDDIEMRRIDEAYSQYSTADSHSGSSHAFMMRLVEKIAKQGFTTFANNVINCVRIDLPSIIRDRQQ